MGLKQGPCTVAGHMMHDGTEHGTCWNQCTYARAETACLEAGTNWDMSAYRQTMMMTG